MNKVEITCAVRDEGIGEARQFRPSFHLVLTKVFRDSRQIHAQVVPEFLTGGFRYLAHIWGNRIGVSRLSTFLHYTN